MQITKTNKAMLKFVVLAKALQNIERRKLDKTLQPTLKELLVCIAAI